MDTWQSTRQSTVLVTLPKIQDQPAASRCMYLAWSINCGRFGPRHKPHAPPVVSREQDQEAQDNHMSTGIILDAAICRHLTSPNQTFHKSCWPVGRNYGRWKVESSAPGRADELSRKKKLSNDFVILEVRLLDLKLAVVPVLASYAPLIFAAISYYHSTMYAAHVLDTKASRCCSSAYPNAAAAGQSVGSVRN